MMPSAIGTTNSRRSRARVKFSNCPPQSTRTPRGQVDPLLHLAAGVVDEPDEIAPADVDLDQHPPLQRFPVDHGRPFRIANGGDGGHRHQLTAGRRDQQLAQAGRAGGGGRLQQHEVEAAWSLEDLAGEAPDPRSLDDLEQRLERHAVASQALSIRVHLEQRETEHALHAPVAAARNVAHHLANLVGDLLERLQVVSKDLDDDVGARAGQELVDAILDRLGDRDERRRHLALDRLLDGVAEAVEICGGDPLVLGTELHHHLGLVGSDRIGRDLRASGARDDGKHLGKAAEDLLDLHAQPLRLRDRHRRKALDVEGKLPFVEPRDELGAEARAQQRPRHRAAAARPRASAADRRGTGAEGGGSGGGARPTRRV